MIVVDVEGVDPDLKKYGTGASKGLGQLYIVGLYDGKDYVCCRPDDPRLRAWLACNEDKIFHNSVYDLTWLLCDTYNFQVGGTWHDTMTRCMFVDEYMDLNLDACCKKFKIPGKNAEDTIDKWFDEKKKIWGLKGTFWDNADLLEHIAKDEFYAVLEKYNKQDCVATYNLFVATEPYLRDLQEAYARECAVMRVIMKMRKVGIRIDEARRDRLIKEMKRLLGLQEQELYNSYGFTGEIIASNKQMNQHMHRIGIKSPEKTSTGADSWAATVLPQIEHPIIPMIINYKNIETILDKFLNQGLTTMVHEGRIYCTIKPTKRDSGGTVTFRMAAAKPNLQQIGSKEHNLEQKSWGNELRSLFLPEEGYMMAAADYGQIEYRMLGHFAHGVQSDWIKEQIRAGVDMHDLAMKITGIQERNIIKRMNFGFIYGMGLEKLIKLDRMAFSKAAKEHGAISLEVYADDLYRTYHSKFPVIRDTMNHVTDLCRAQGYIRTIGGGIQHKPKPALSRRGTWEVPYYIMLNHLIQSSCAEVFKQALVECDAKGLFDVCPVHLPVHDEVVMSVPFNKEGAEALSEIKRTMVETYKDRLTVPLSVGVEVGPNWGYWHKDIWEEMQKGVFAPDAWKRTYAPKSEPEWFTTRHGYIGV